MRVCFSTVLSRSLSCKVVIRRVKRMSRVPCMGMAMVVIPFPLRYYLIILIRKAL